LVRPEQAPQAVAILQGLGYETGAALIRDDFFPRFHYEREMTLPGLRPVRIDLHAHPWRPLPLSQQVRPEEFWRGAKRTAVGDAAIWLPSPEIQWLHLAAHAAFHDCSRWIWLYDLKRFVDRQSGPLDWTQVVDRARRWGVALAAYKALVEAESLLGPFVPTDAVRSLLVPRPGWRERLMLWHAPRDAASPLMHVLCNTLGLRGLPARLAYARAMLVPHRRHLGESYPFRHPGWPACAHLCRIARNTGRIATNPISLIRRASNPAGVAT
jgi:hypothetical protein